MHYVNNVLYGILIMYLQVVRANLHKLYKSSLSKLKQNFNNIVAYLVLI